MKARRRVVFWVLCTLLVGPSATSESEANARIMKDSKPAKVPIGIGVPGLGEDGTLGHGNWGLANELGVNFLRTLWGWKELEPRPGTYAWTQTPTDPRREYLKDLKEHGFTVAIGDSTVHMDHKHLPEHFAKKRFNDSDLLRAWENYLVAFMEQYGDFIDYFMIGNEVVSYFGDKPAEWKDYVAFFKRGAEVVRRERPSMPVGIILAIEGSDKRAYWRDVESHCGFLSVNYYTPCSTFSKDPTANALNPDHPKYFAKTLGKAFEWAGGRPIMISEIGCATSPKIDSSPELQVQFIQQLFDWLRANEEQLLGMSWLSIQDWPKEIQDWLRGSLSNDLLEHDGFMGYLTSLGLLYEDGTPKPGYDVFKNEVLRYQSE